MSEFQIGDVVKVTGNRGEDGNGVPHYFEDGVIATVAEGKDSEGDYYVTNNDATGIPLGQFVNEHNLERLPFQAGEKVLVRNGGGLGAFDGEETKAEVIEFGGWMGDSIEDRRLVAALDDPDWWQVVLVRDMETLPLFEQGDKVRIIGNGGDRIEHYFTVGDVGEVTSDRDYDGDYLVAVDGIENYVHESHLEKDEDEDEQTLDIGRMKDDGPEARPCYYGGVCYSCDGSEPEEGDRAWTTEFEVGTRVRVVNAGQANNAEDGDTGVVVDKSNGHLGGRVLHSVRLDRTGEATGLFGYRLVAQDEPNRYPFLNLSDLIVTGPLSFADVSGVAEAGEALDIVNNPPHYKFSNGAEVIDITENLTSNGGQAVQYIARSTRLDGNNKGDVLEDLRKAEFFVRREIERIENNG